MDPNLTVLQMDFESLITLPVSLLPNSIAVRIKMLKSDGVCELFDRFANLEEH